MRPGPSGCAYPSEAAAPVIPEASVMEEGSGANDTCRDSDVKVTVGGGQSPQPHTQSEAHAPQGKASWFLSCFGGSRSKEARMRELVAGATSAPVRHG